MKDVVTMFLKTMLVIVFAIFMVWAFHDFDMNAVFNFARSKTVVFIYIIFMAGFIGWITVNKIKRD